MSTSDSQTLAPSVSATTSANRRQRRRHPGRQRAGRHHRIVGPPQQFEVTALAAIDDVRHRAVEVAARIADRSWPRAGARETVVACSALAGPVGRLDLIIGGTEDHDLAPAAVEVAAWASHGMRLWRADENATSLAGRGLPQLDERAVGGRMDDRCRHPALRDQRGRRPCGRGVCYAVTAWHESVRTRGEGRRHLRERC